jgi:hypothetical protein
MTATSTKTSSSGEAWERAGNSLHLANRVAIGHAELMVRWPDINLNVHYQAMTDYQQQRRS